MSKRERDKGAAYEREIVQNINDRFPAAYSAKRRLGQARDAGHDIEWRLSRFILEAKRRARQIGAQKWLDQASAACAKDDQIPIVVTRGDGGRSVAVLYFDDLLTLILELAFSELL